ncbi:MAG: 16S rRNA (guanine(527)-N(7))-methyltransferase RsmG [Nitrospira sp.]|nr:16S rRNA (guanine(527)-N(7))-methyltransferase RsmG [Nitrospira sp.]
MSELKTWNQAINLTAIDQDLDILVKHFIDSISGIKVIDSIDEKIMLDIGAGAGFPSIPLKFIRPDLAMVLLEPSEKRSSFLRYMIGSLGLRDMAVVTAKFEDYVRRPASAQAFDWLVVRALKVEGWRAEIGALLKPGGKAILYRAERVGKGFGLDSLALLEEVEYELPSGYGHRVLSVFAK